MPSSHWYYFFLPRCLPLQRTSCYSLFSWCYLKFQLERLMLAFLVNSVRWWSFLYFEYKVLPSKTHVLMAWSPEDGSSIESIGNFRIWNLDREGRSQVFRYLSVSSSDSRMHWFSSFACFVNTKAVFLKAKLRTKCWIKLALCFNPRTLRCWVMRHFPKFNGTLSYIVGLVQALAISKLVSKWEVSDMIETHIKNTQINFYSRNK